MKKFQFSLERVLQLKKFNEEEGRMALGIAISILNEIENNIKENALKHYQASNEKLNDPSQMIIWNNYLVRLEHEKEELLEKATHAEIVVEEKREIYTESLKELRAMEKLKEKKEKLYKKEMDVKESALVDELYAAKAKSNEQ